MEGACSAAKKGTSFGLIFAIIVCETEAVK
jgi:hypothetical protein